MTQKQLLDKLAGWEVGQGPSMGLGGVGGLSGEVDVSELYVEPAERRQLGNFL